MDENVDDFVITEQDIKMALIRWLPILVVFFCFFNFIGV